jgi:hypothetical protein
MGGILTEAVFQAEGRISCAGPQRSEYGFPAHPVAEVVKYRKAQLTFARNPGSVATYFL